MNITISGHQLDSSDSLDAHIHKKANKLGVHFEDINSINVILSKVKGLFTVEVDTHYDGKSFSVTASDTDMYQAVADAFKKLDTRLKSQKSIKLAQRHDVQTPEPDSIELAS